MNDACSTLDSLRGGVRGRLNIGSIPTITPYFLAPRLAEFVRLYPDVELRLSEDITPKLIQRIKEGELDLAVVGLPVRNPDIVCSELFREQIVVALKKGHRLSREPRVRVAQLKQERMLLLKEGHCFRDDALTACRRGSAAFASVFETDQFSSIFSLIAGGFGTSLVPKMATIGQAECDFIPLEKDAARRVGYIRAQRRVASPAQRSFVEWLRRVSKGNAVIAVRSPPMMKGERVVFRAVACSGICEKIKKTSPYPPPLVFEPLQRKNVLGIILQTRAPADTPIKTVGLT
jgi:LysR family transcriptional regulator, hydrogen peroxide-inducible genes activator